MNISPVRTKYKRIPIADCPACGLKDTPLSQEHRKFKHKETGKELDLWFVYCPRCEVIINWDEESSKIIKGYVSVRDLKKMGWEKK